MPLSIALLIPYRGSYENSISSNTVPSGSWKHTKRVIPPPRMVSLRRREKLDPFGFEVFVLLPQVFRFKGNAGDTGMGEMWIGGPVCLGLLHSIRSMRVA